MLKLGSFNIAVASIADYPTNKNLPSAAKTYTSAPYHMQIKIKAMRGKFLRSVGPDKGGFWEVIET